MKETRWDGAKLKRQFESGCSLWTRVCWKGGGANKCSPTMFDETSIHCLSEEKKSSAATGGKQDWFSAYHQNSVKPIAWQPTDLRSPSIVCVIDYFPCNYSRCQTQYFTAPGKVQEGLSFWRTTFILSHSWAPYVVHEEAQVKLKSCMGRQWWLVLIDCCVIPLCRQRLWDYYS